MAALFGGSGDGRREARSLVEFRAGKMKLSGSTVTADTRKGLVFMRMEEGLLHFYWKDRKLGEIVDDFIIFPGDAELKRVPQCTTGRVFLLKFRDSSSRKFFYWMQEPKEEKDNAYLTKVNELIEHPPDPNQPAAGEGMAGLPHGFLGVPSQLQNLLGMSGGGGGGGARRIDQQQLMELVNSGALGPIGGMGGLVSPFEGASQGGSRPSTTPLGSQLTQSSRRHRQERPQPSQQALSHQLQLGDLRNILSSMNIPVAEGEGEGETAPPQDQVNLHEVVTPDVLRPLASDREAQDQLAPHLPPTEETTETVLTSPQFQQALGVFGSALQSGELGPLVGQFGLGERVVEAANTGDLHGFAEALQGEMGGAPTDQSDQPKPEEGERLDPEGREGEESSKVKETEGEKKDSA